ncbi:Pentatricopeptide repeat-containing protein [Thalictrum thalictroides]|uniref:Pentatricopeptide repeat-containing protein n=1 Tax=Thalictrum thalictroides TaxID=46969 RepID=A0A7J6VYI6_THATH|nr:Pentatricopeptide repeat-containing protein [Thalictrum thalictroides]
MFIWNTLIRGYAKSSNPSKAISFYYYMVQCGVLPDNFTYPFVLIGCARIQEVKFGERFHCEVLKNGFLSDVFVVNGVVQVYVSCGCFEFGCKVFDESSVRDIVTWNVMIGGYCSKGFYEKAFECFENMRKGDGIEPDDVTMISLVSACAKMGNLEQGRVIHSYAKEFGLEKHLKVGNAVLDMYCKCGDLEASQHLFDTMHERDVFTWTSLISGMVISGYFRESLVLFGRMQCENIRPDEVTLVSVLSACAQLGALEQGKYVHLLMDRYEVNRDVVLETALVDMYAKCGSIEFALQVFHGMRVKNVFTWNTIIGGLAMHGHGKHVMRLFEQMKCERILPDGVTFIGLLCACSHTRLVSEGLELFRAMKEDYHIEPRMEHYGCIVDLLCRAKLVSDALAFIENMPFQANSVMWANLHGACSISGNFELAQKVGQRVIELEPDSCGRYVQLSNFYAGIHQWNEAQSIRKEMKSKGIEKAPGCSWIEMNGIVHQFIAGDRSHIETEKIYMMIEEMCQRVKLAGIHVSRTTQVMFDIEEEEKEHSLFLHSEKLAIAFGLINTSPGSPIQIVKNLRVCNDCHSFIKIISKAFNRTIVARDRSRFHHFREGSCSCRDFW